MLFMYLWDRRYLTPDYRHGGIIRMLDGWVARLIRFKETRADYHMLNELPQRLREHAAKAAEEAERQQQSLLAMEKQAAEKDGVAILQAALDTAEKQLQQVNDDIEAEEKRYQELLRQKNDFASGEDEYTQKAVALMAAELEREDVIALFQQAQSTPRPEDDAIVMRLHQLQQDTQDPNRSHFRAKNQSAAAAQCAGGACQRCAKSSVAATTTPRASSFPANLGLGVLLGEILRGGISSGSAWDRIDHSQKWDFPDAGGSGRGGSGRSRGRSGGGFGGFGGFGSGGEFRWRWRVSYRRWVLIGCAWRYELID